MSHPYADLEGTPLWARLDAALAELEANGDLALATTRPNVVGLICRRLSDAGFDVAPASTARPGAAELAAFLEAAATAWPSDDAWRAQLGTSYREAHVEEARRQAGLTQLRHAQGSLSTAQASEYLRAIARGLAGHLDRGA
jgi:hypothetical protein